MGEDDLVKEEYRHPIIFNPGNLKSTLVVDTMEKLPLGVLVKILDEVEGWKNFIGCRLVSKRFKNAADMALLSKAKAAVKATPWLRQGYWREKIDEFPGFTMNVLCASPFPFH